MEGDSAPLGEPERLLYIQDGVILKSITAKSLYIGCTGTLSIVEYPHHKISIDWKPKDFVLIDSLQEQEWTVVNTRLTTLSNHRFLLENIDKITTLHKIITLTGKKGIGSATFYFPHGNADTFSRNINIHCEILKVHKNAVHIVTPNLKPTTNGSLADLDDFFYDPSSSYGLRSFVRNIAIAPVDTIWKAGAKLGIFSAEEAAEKSSLNSMDSDNVEVGNWSLDEFELSPRPEILRGIPLLENQLIVFRDDTGSISEVEIVKEIIFKGGVEHTLRSEVWKYLLNYFPWNTTDEERKVLRHQKSSEYYTMKTQWKSITPMQENRFTDFHERKSLVKKDVDRTDRTFDFYAGDDNPNIDTLNDILMTFVMYNFDLGYVQGMSDLLSPILFVLKDEVDAFWCFVGFMDKVHTNFDIDQAGMKLQLQQLYDLTNFVCPKLANYLREQSSANMYFCFRWLLVLFKRELSLHDTMRLWEVLWTGKPCKNFHLLVSVAILDSEKTVFEERGYGFAKILKHVNDLSMHINLDHVLSKAEAIYHQIVSAPHLTNEIRRILGLEEVIVNQPAKDEEISSPVQNGVKENGSDASVSTSNGIRFKADKEEVAYQRSIDLSFL
ncbi:TBC1 domain family member 15/17 [Arctopsyche grandis]|uniref:TBC1 domain family member 15/17 n=1 Tax=Arctopsyche grandis TaxID=121162 RepID=UPI00406D648D